MSDLALGQLVLFATTLLGFIVAAWREARNRRWASDDRAAATAAIVAIARAEAEATRIRAESVAEMVRLTAIAEAESLREESRRMADRLRLETDKAARDLREMTLHQVSMAHTEAARAKQELLMKIQESTDAALEAQKEANHINLKISNLDERLVEQNAVAKTMVEKTATTLEHVESMLEERGPQITTIEDTTAAHTGQLQDIQARVAQAPNAPGRPAK